MQADTTNYFVVWWVLFECSSFDSSLGRCPYNGLGAPMLLITSIKKGPALT